MGGLLIIGLLIVLFGKLWPLLLGVLILLLIWWFIVVPLRNAHAQEVRDRLRHEAARREIDRIAAETTRAMHHAAAASGEVIEGSATEVER
jgi:hypothetical protein